MNVIYVHFVLITEEILNKKKNKDHVSLIICYSILLYLHTFAHLYIIFQKKSIHKKEQVKMRNRYDYKYK